MKNWKNGDQIKAMKYIHVKQPIIFLYRLKSGGIFLQIRYSFFGLMKVNEFPFRFESVNMQAHLSLNLAALFVHVLAEVKNESTLYSHLYIFGPELHFISAAVYKEYVCTAPANE